MVSGAVRNLYGSLGVKGLTSFYTDYVQGTSSSYFNVTESADLNMATRCIYLHNLVTVSSLRNSCMFPMRQLLVRALRRLYRIITYLIAIKYE